MSKFSIKIGGAAGQGIKSAGLTLSKLATRSGYHIYSYTEYPSLIRGGHNVMQIIVSEEAVFAPSKNTDLLIALNQETVDLHFTEIAAGGGILFDVDEEIDISRVDKNINLFKIPLSKIARESGGNELLINTVAIGAMTALIGGSLEVLNNLIEEEFTGKKPEIIVENHTAAGIGYAFALENFKTQIKEVLTLQEQIVPRIVVDGNDAISLGAISAGMQFAAIYPMTPVTSIMTNLAEWEEKGGYIFKQPEDELSAINMAIGASFAGAKSLTATSGGGFCLMTEGLSLAGMTEIPVVIILGMRPGPSTGMPTWSEQGDLQFALHAGQGDFPRIVLAAGDVEEAFYLTQKAFDMVDKYRTPVIVLTDKNLSENTQSFTPFPSVVKNNQQPATLISTSSDEHDENGFSIDDIKTRNQMMERRMKKLEDCKNNDMEKPKLYGLETADLTIVSWGSNKGSILEALKNFPNINYLHITWMNPFPVDDVKNILSNAKKVLGIEANFSGQLMNLIREKTGIEVTDKLLKYDGRPIFPEEITAKIEEVLKV